jgi:MinD-like ATPase involved in chromosome partitioning or flagellar assembly|nr:MAG TPA: ParA [Bacteriophage sp.]
MKAIIVYSGKGGVGKTTTTANIARLFAEQGNKVFIIDADINTPSMNTEFSGDHPEDNIWIHSSGNMFDNFIYLEKSMVRQYLELAKKKLRLINPDFVLIDTPPSVTNVHIELLSRIKVSYVLFVTQPTKLSTKDVIRTMNFFHEKCGKVKCGIVENMCYDNEKREYPIKLVAQIPMQDKMNTGNLLHNAKGEFQKIIDEVVSSESVVLEEYSTENGYDESFDIVDMCLTGSRRSYVQHELKYDDGTEKTLNLPAPKFLSVRTWDKVRRYILYHDDIGCNFDARIEKCNTEIIGRTVNHFKNDENAYFMVINAPNTEVHLITGEIGICSLLTGQKYHYEIPRVSYQTSKGSVVLFPDEVMPVDMELLQQQINEGYIMLSDGRYLPPKETVECCYNAFGSRVGLLDGWEMIYDEWINK